MVTDRTARPIARAAVALGRVLPGLVALFCCLSAAASVEPRLPQLVTEKRLKFGESAAAPASAGVEVAWTFDARANAVIRLSVEGASRTRLRGPKVLGGDWNTPWDFEGVAASDVTFTVPRTGRYGAFLLATGGTPVSLRIKCENPPCDLPAWPLGRNDERVNITAVGDTGLQPHRAPDDDQGGYKYGEYHLFTEMIEGFERFLDDGDLNVVNIETAVTSAGKRTPKRFNFRMHENGLATLARAGFDAFAMANNHAGDYGTAGLLDSVAALVRLREQHPDTGYAGIGPDFASAIRPHIFVRGGLRIAHASIGFGFHFSRSGPYMADLSDLEAVLDALSGADADLRILSAHFGSERHLVPGSGQREFVQTVMDAGIDILHGHHPHVVQGIERIGNGLVLYSLGNFLLRGARNMGTLNVDMDYGIAVRIGVNPHTAALETLEVIPVYDMHRAPFPLEADAARKRIERLNVRSKSLGANGVQLRVDAATGFGIADLVRPCPDADNRGEAAEDHSARPQSQTPGAAPARLSEPRPECVSETLESIE